MELISEILILAIYTKGTEHRAEWITGEGSWFGMIVLGVMLAVVIYWAVWNIKTASQKKKKMQSDGQKEREANYKDGKVDGLLVQWHENGQKRSEANYKDGKRDGRQVSWHENGQKRSEGNYKDGKLDGLWLIWHENGQKKGEANWKDEKIISAKYWNNKGEPFDSWKETEEPVVG
jgi:uncharacterized protein with FMN-binding domain